MVDTYEVKKSGPVPELERRDELQKLKRLLIPSVGRKPRFTLIADNTRQNAHSRTQGIGGGLGMKRS